MPLLLSIYRSLVLLIYFCFGVQIYAEQGVLVRVKLKPGAKFVRISVVVLFLNPTPSLRYALDRVCSLYWNPSRVLIEVRFLLALRRIGVLVLKLLSVVLNSFGPRFVFEMMLALRS